MTSPRPVYPDTMPFITRRCSERRFFLRPDDGTNNAFVYCLAVAAQRYEVGIVLAVMMSNHHHTQTYDPHGRHVEFRQYFHSLLARCQNAYRGRWENLWATVTPSVVEVAERDDLMRRLVYIATNPVKDGLVERAHHWPGPNFVKALLSGEPMRARRPSHFFRAAGDMPEEVELQVALPPHIEAPGAFLDDLRRRIADVEESYASERLATGKQVVGRRRVKRQSWRDHPSSHEPRRVLGPRVAARDTWARVARLQRNKDFEIAHRDARRELLAGRTAVFPYGTYWLRRFASVTVAPPPHDAKRELRALTAEC